MDGSRSVSIVQLAGSKNYATWRVQMKMYLLRDKLWSIVEETETAPSDTAALNKFNERRDRALAAIVLFIEPKILYLIGEPKDPVAVWKTLRDTYQQKSWSNIMDLKRKLTNTKLQPHDTIENHLKRFTEIFDSLAVVGKPMDEDDKVMTVLASLNDKFAMVVTALESLENAPSWEMTTTRLLHEERKMQEKETDSSVGDSENRSLVSKQKNKRAIKCYECGKSGHVRKNCFVFQRKTKENDKSFKANRVVEGAASRDKDVMFLASALSVTGDQTNSWLIDSGATSHMCNNIKMFSQFEELDVPVSVEIGDGKILKGIGTGIVNVQLELPNSIVKNCVMSSVLYVPGLAFNLLSVAQIARRGMVASFSDDSCKIVNSNNELMALGRKEGNLYMLNCSSEVAASCASDLNASEDEMLWHRRFCHLGVSNLRKLVNKKMVVGLECSPSEDFFCDSCCEGKIHKQPFVKLETRKKRQPLELIHSDVCGKITPSSTGGGQYFLTLIDDSTRYTWIYILKHKSEVFEHFRQWKTLVEKQYGSNVKVLRTDNGGEFTSGEFESFLRNEGIKHEKTIPKTPEQNGVAERKNRTLVEAVRSMLSDSGLPKTFWAEALSTATYVQNRAPTVVLGEKTPYEVLNKRKPNVKHLKVFGCEAYAHVPSDERSKLASKSRKCVFLGYSNVTKGYRLYDLESRKIFHSRNVLFREKFGSQVKSVEEEQDSSELESRVFAREEEPGETIEEPEETIAEPEETIEEAEGTVDDPGNSVSTNELRRSTRQTKPPERLGEWLYNCSTNEESNDPRTVKEALASPDAEKWKQAMNLEMEAMQSNNVWSLVKQPADQKVVGSKWIFKRKLDSDGSVCSYKARLVAKGFQQQEGINYDETFSPVVRFESVRTILALAATHELHVHQMDVSTAFLNGELDEDVFMTQPEGFSNTNSNLVCKLNKSIYGLKQAPKCWNNSIDTFLKDMNFSQSSSDSCIYTKVDNGSVCIIALYVDDLLIASKSIDEINQLKLSLCSRYKMKDLGKLSYFLGVKVTQKDSNIFISQAAYTESLLVKFNFANVKPVSTPVNDSSQLEKADEDSELFDAGLYQSAVGSLLYLSTKTRPDITFAVCNVAKFCSKPTNIHWSAVKRIFRYLKGTVGLGLMYKMSNKNCTGYSDADWAGDRSDRRSTSGQCFILGSGLISWRTSKQKCVALSTAEAEYVALAAASQEAVWLRQLLKDLKFGSDDPLVVNEDNQSAICIAKNPKDHAKTKHIQIKYHFVRDLIQQNVLVLKYCPTEEMLADVFTKPLPKTQFEKLRNMMGMMGTLSA